MPQFGDRDKGAQLAQFHSSSLSGEFNHFIGRIGTGPPTVLHLGEDDMIFRQFLHKSPIGASYLFGCGGQAKCVVVDPVDDISLYEETSRETGMQIVYVIDTHVHADHLSGGRALADAVGARYLVHESVDAPEGATVADGQELSIGNVAIRVLHTPGHTPEHVSLLVSDRTRGTEPWFLLTGHTLMVGDLGRTELATSADVGARMLFESAARLRALPDHVEVWPGAFAGSLCGRRLSGKAASTIGFERRFNRAFATDDLDVFVQLMLADLPAPPPNAAAIRATNLNAIRGETPARR
jgi:glyoxylase-like metal-dependent hydrolase (beta-lactamase superfamily II)